VELLDAFASNSSLAGALGAAHALTGTWRSTVSDMRQVEQLTPADVQQVCADGLKLEVTVRRRCITAASQRCALAHARRWCAAECPARPHSACRLSY